MEVLKDFVRQNLKYSSIFFDASSSQALDKSVEENITQSTSGDTLLVLQNPSAPVEEYIHRLPYIPVLVITTQPSMESSTAFQLPDCADQQQVKKLLCSIEEAFDPRQHVVTLIGNGGTGKTQAVLQFVSKNFSRFSNVWFFDASSQDTLAANFKELGQAVGIGEDVKDVRDFLARMHENWLCIFDNADDKTIFLKEYIPNCNHGNVIVTTRLSETLKMASSPGCQIDLMDLTRETAVELLLSHAHEQRTLENQNLASKIVEALGCHALAVSTAGAYIGATQTCALGNYLAHFNKEKKRFLNYRMRSLDIYQSTVFSTFQLSFEKLSPSAQYLMQICAYLHPTYIPIEIFTRAATFTGSDTSSVDLSLPTESIHILERFLSQFVEEESWYDSVDELLELSLVSYDHVKKSLAIPPVIHTCAQETTVDWEYMKQTASLLLGRATPLGGSMEDYIFRRELLVQASSFQIDDLPTVHVQICFARIFWQCGFWVKAEKLQEEVLVQNKRVHEDHHPDTLTSMGNLAIIYHEQGKLDVAQQLQEEVIAKRKEVLGEHHTDTLTSMNNLAITYQVQGKLDAAQQLQGQVIAKCREVLGEHHPATLTSMGNIAIIYRAQGKLDAAQQLHKQVLAQRKEVLGEYHPDTLISMGDLANTYYVQGKLDAAQYLHEQVFAQRKEVLGGHHPDALTSMNHLAMTYHEQGKLDEAQQLHEQVLAQRKEVLRKHHPAILNSMSNLAYIYQEQGKLDAAQYLQEKVLAQCKEVLGEHHPDTLISMGNLAMTYQLQGKLDAAQQLQEQVFAPYKE
ncbi:TPR-like protein, partial [Gymnopus androsaceus JB14]